MISKKILIASHKGFLKIGYTERDVKTRVAEQMHTSAVPYRIVLTASAMRSDGSCFTDHEVHAALRRRGYKQLNAGEDQNEWYKCDLNAVKAAIISVRDNTANTESRTLDFKMRPEQTVAVLRTMEYFQKAKKEDPDRAPKFLWNCKMRFGKTFATYEFAKITPNIVYEGSSTGSVELVKADMGVALHAEEFTRVISSDPGLVSIPIDPPIEFNYGVAYRDPGTMSHAEQIYLSHLKQFELRK